MRMNALDGKLLEISVPVGEDLVDLSKCGKVVQSQQNYTVRHAQMQKTLYLQQKRHLIEQKFSWYLRHRFDLYGGEIDRHPILFIHIFYSTNVSLSLHIKTFLREEREKARSGTGFALRKLRRKSREWLGQCRRGGVQNVTGNWLLQDFPSPNLIFLCQRNYQKRHFIPRLITMTERLGVTRELLPRPPGSKRSLASGAKFPPIPENGSDSGQLMN